VLKEWVVTAFPTLIVWISELFGSLGSGKSDVLENVDRFEKTVSAKPGLWKT
jgi:hypothetical protein